MYVKCSGSAVVRDANTGVEYEISNEELDWEISASNLDRDMGPEHLHQAMFEHDKLGLLTWQICEYPLGVKSYCSTDVGRHELVSNLIFDLEHESNDPEDWLDFPAPDDPITIFNNSYDQMKVLLQENGSNDGRDLLNRMVFSHHVTALEAYLSDTLINAVMDEPEFQQRLITRAEELKQEKFTLEDIFNKPDLVQRTVHKYLRGVLYHNLSKVDVIYKITLGFGILNNMKDKDKMFIAVKLRHDCVHRNGRTQDGNELRIFTKKFVQSTADSIKDLVLKVQEETIKAQKKIASRDIPF